MSARPTARGMAEAQVLALRSAIDIGSDPCALAIARRYLARSEAALRDLVKSPLSWSAGMLGENGWQPGIDAVCRTLHRSALMSDSGCAIVAENMRRDREAHTGLIHLDEVRAVA